MRTFTPMQYLKMDIAANFGMDGATWEDRLAWFQEHRLVLWDMLKEAKEPSQFYAGVLAYEDVMEGKPTGYMCSWDSSASGIQLLAVLAGCVKSASQCNLVNTGRREDAYLNLYAHMCEALGTISKIGRKPVKQALT